MSTIGHKRNLSALSDVQEPPDQRGPPGSKSKREVIDLTDSTEPVVSGRIFIPRPTHTEISRLEKRFADFAEQFERRPAIQAFLRRPYIKTNHVTYTTDYEGLTPCGTPCTICTRSDIEPNIWTRVIVTKTPNGFATHLHDYDMAQRMHRLDADELCYRHVCYDCADDMYTFFREGPVDRRTLELLDTKVMADVTDLIHAYITDCRPK